MGRLIKDEKWLNGVPAENVSPVPYQSMPDEAFDALLSWQYSSDKVSLPGPSLVFRKWAPYQPGTVIRGPDGLCRVIAIFAEYLDGRDDWIVKYRVQHLTKKRTWSKVFTYLYPGLIVQAYKEAANVEHSDAPKGDQQ